MVNHSGAASGNAMIAGMIALASVAVYWYMTTTEEERASQANELKEKADNALEQANGTKKTPSNIHLSKLWEKKFFLLTSHYKTTELVS